MSNSSQLNYSLITSQRKEPNNKWKPSAFSKSFNISKVLKVVWIHLLLNTGNEKLRIES